MSFSLQLKDGDLALSGTSLGTVENSDKLQQDLICAILTPLGFDELHPSFGSTLEANIIDPNAQEIIGSRNWRQVATIVRNELLRLCQNYQAQQIARNESDASRFGRFTLTPEEILLSVIDIRFIQAEDKLVCTLELEIGNNTLELQIPVSGLGVH